MAKYGFDRAAGGAADIVIVYSRKDSGALADCSAALSSEGYSVWWDRDMTAGRLWKEQVNQQIDRSRKVIALWSTAASQSDEVGREMAYAYGQNKLIPLCIDDAQRNKIYASLEHKRITNFLDQIEDIKDAIEFIPVRAAITPPANFEIDLGELPRAPQVLFGREREIAALKAAWQETSPARKKNAFVLHALGGAGKSSLASRFIIELANEGYGGARRVFAWSAYSQGNNKRADTGSLFDSALAFFRYDGPPLSDRVAQARALARILQNERSLLVLDGLEPLQGVQRGNGGKLTDPALATLIKRLADHNPGLLIITSRQQLPELEGHERVVNWRLEQLPNDAAAALLRRLGVVGRDDQLNDAVKELEGHALSVELLGNYIANVERGDIRRRYTFRLADIVDTDEEIEAEDHTERLAKRTNKILRGYVEQLQKLEMASHGRRASVGGGDPEISLLKITGLFDRPVDGAALACLLEAPQIVGITDGFHVHKERTRNWLIPSLEERPLTTNERSQRLRFAKERLRALGILSSQNAIDPDGIDAHPLVRQYFADEVRQTHPTAFAEAHGRLYDHYRQAAPERPDTLKDMEPLFHAVRHGCLSGHAQQAFYEIYWVQISRYNAGFAARTLGAVAPLISVVANFFEEPWSKPRSDLVSESRKNVVNQASYLLTASGRLQEALDVLEGERRSGNHYRNAQYSNLLLDLGRVEEAADAARENLAAVERIVASKPNSIRQLISALAQLASVYACQSRNDDAARLFDRAEKLQHEHINQPRRQFLFSTNGFKYCVFLLNIGRFDMVRERAENSLIIAKKDINHLSIGLDRALLARAQALEEGPSPAVKQSFDQAVAELRLANRDEYLPRILLWRAENSRRDGRLEDASEDLEEVQELGSFGDMALVLADYKKERAALDSRVPAT